MHPPRPALWCLLALATLPASSSAASIFEVDVVFPRNATYAPSDNFPVVLAFKNAGLAKDLQFSLLSAVHNGSEGNPHTVGTPKPWTYDLDLIMKEANVSSDEPLFLRAYSIDLSYEGQHNFWLSWDYAYCSDNIGTPPKSFRGGLLGMAGQQPHHLGQRRRLGRPCVVHDQKRRPGS